MADRKLVVKIIGDASSLERTFRQASRQTQTFGARLGRIAKAGALAGAALGVGGLALSIRAGTKELAEQQRVAAQTEAALKSTGGAANVSAKQIEVLGLALSNLSGVDDEVIKSGSNMLLSFTKIRNEVGKGNAIFDRATKAALDFAVRTGRDVPQAAIILGKALEDPAKKLSGLARAGIIFSDAQKKMIAGLVASGHQLQAQKIVLAELEKRFGGAAAAAGGTLVGRLRILQERFHDLTADLLTAFLPSLNRGVEALTKIVRSFSAWSSKTENQRRLQDDVNKVVNTAVAVFEGLRDVLVPVARVAGQAAEKLGGMKNAVKALIAVAIAAKLAGFASAITGIGTQAALARGQVAGLRLSLLRLARIGVITVGIELLLNQDKVNDFLKRSHLGFLTLTPTEAVNKLRQMIPGGILKLDSPLPPSVDGREDATRGLPSPAAAKATKAAREAATVARAAREKADAEQERSERARLSKLAATAAARAKILEDKADALARAQIENERKRHQRIVTARRSSQFKTLGLSGTGEAQTPGVAALKSRGAALENQIKGTSLDTPKVRSKLAAIAKVLAQGYRKVGKDVRAAILQMLNDIAGALEGKGGKQGPLTKTTGLNTKKFLEGIGLSPDEIRELRGRLSNFNSAGMGLAGSQTRGTGGFAGGAVVVENNVTVAINGQKFSAVVTKEQQKTRRRNPKQKRGPNRRTGGV